MQVWWDSLAGDTRFFYGMAAFFSVFFIWQMAAAFLGLDGDDGMPDDLADEVDHHSAGESSQAFKLLSLRSIVTFFTLFSWGGALYTGEGMATLKAVWISSLWGLGGMIATAAIFYALGKLTETGTKDIGSSQGQAGTVYLDIPANGFGEVRTTVGGVVEHIKAKSTTGEALPAGTEVRVVEVQGQSLISVEKITP